MVDAEPGEQRNNLIVQLKQDSEFLENQREELLGIWKSFKQKIFSFYETKKTPSVRKVNSTPARVTALRYEMMNYLVCLGGVARI